MKTVDMTDVVAGCEKIKPLMEKFGHTKAIATYKDGHKERVRLAWHGDTTPMIMAKGRRRWGNSLRSEVLYAGIVAISIPEVTPVDEEVKWRKSWEKVVERLNKSGLFVDYREDIETALEIGYAKIKEANDVYWKVRDEEAIKFFEAFEPRWVKTHEDGRKYVSSEAIWKCHHPAKIKKMNFGKYYGNERKLADIAQAFSDKTPISVSGRNGYDVSFSYNPDQKRAWYSEEYRNCGNGHYYLALDATHAVFYEDD